MMRASSLSAYSTSTRYMTVPREDRAPESRSEALRIYLNIMLGVGFLYLVFTYLLPLMY